MSRYHFIQVQREHYPVRLLCYVVSGYYAWQQARQQATKQGAPAWETALVKVFGWHKRRYGTRPFQVALRQKGHRVGRQRLRASMRRRGLQALQPKAYTPRTTDSTHGLRCAPNRLLDQLKPARANRVTVPPGRHLGSVTSLICRWPTVTGRTYVHFNTWPANKC